MPFGGLLTLGIIGAAGGLTSGILGANASESAAGEQAAATEQGIQEQQREFNIQQQNAQPFVSAGQSSIGQIMQGIQNGTFGPGSLPAAPQYTGGPFVAPTLAQAEQTPGYQFTEQQGEKGILQAAGAAGGAISRGTIDASDEFAQNLAQTTYQQQFQNALTQYQTGLQSYQAQLAGYGSALAGQQQEFGQLTAPAQIGSGSTAALNATGASTATSIAGLMQGIGTSQAAGTVGAANALSSGLAGGANSIEQSLLLGRLLNSGLNTGGVMSSVPLLPGQDPSSYGVMSSVPLLPGQDPSSYGGGSP